MTTSVLEIVASRAESYAERLGAAARQWATGRSLDGTETFLYDGRRYDVVREGSSLYVWPVGHASAFWCGSVTA